MLFCGCLLVGRSIGLWHVGENFSASIFLLTTGTEYDDFLKLYLPDVDIVSGKRDDKYLGESF